MADDCRLSVWFLEQCQSPQVAHSAQPAREQVCLPANSARIGASRPEEEREERAGSRR
jgi:hypothetical protein